MITGGTLMISRYVKNHAHYKKRLEALGFPNVTLTARERDGLCSQIDDLKPDLVIMGARFYQCSTPYMMGELKKKFPDTNMAALCIGEYPADLAMYFILNGVTSFAMSSEGVDEWYKGIDDIRKGREYVTEVVLDRIAMRDPRPEPARVLSKLMIEVVRCICNGFTKQEIANNLAISERTVEKHREEIYRFLNVRGGEDLIRTALGIKLVTQEELVFKHPNFVCTPLPEKQYRGKMIIRTKSGEFQSGDASVLLDFLGVPKSAAGVLKVPGDVELIASVPFRLTADSELEKGYPWTLTTFDLDRFGERIDPAGWDFKRYMDNPVVEWAHRYDIPAIGKIEGLAADGEGLHGLVVFNDKSFDAFGWSIGERVKAGVIRAGSVGFRAVEIEIPSKADSKDGTALIFRKQELLEFSICNVPANPFALAKTIEAAKTEQSQELSCPRTADLRSDGSTFWGGLINNF